MGLVMGFNFREAATSGLYALAGAAEGMRRHQEFVEADEKNRFAERMDRERMALDRYRVETGVMQQADALALQEKEFIDEKAKWQAQLEFEKKKLDEQKRQFQANYPLESRKVGALEKTAESRETSAAASVTRANAARDKVQQSGGAITPKGILQEYGKTYRTAYNAKKEAILQRFGKFGEAEQQEAEVAATNAAKAAISESIEAYNSFVYTGQNPTAAPIGAADVEAMYDQQEDVDESGSQWEAMHQDPTLSTRFDEGKLSEDEIAAFKANDIGLYNAYQAILKKKAMQKKLDDDRKKADAARRTQRQKTVPERKLGPADFR